MENHVIVIFLGIVLLGWAVKGIDLREWKEAIRNNRFRTRNRGK